MIPLRKIIFQLLLSFQPLRIYIIISLFACLLSLTWGQIATTQTPEVSPSSSVEESMDPPNPTPILNPSPQDKNPSPTLRKSSHSLVKSDPQVQELIKRFNITPEEAIKLLQKRRELEELGLLHLSSGKIGNLNYMAVKLDGRIIFPLASYSQENKNGLKGRVQKIENTLNEIIKRNIPANQIRVFPSILHKQTVIVISRNNQSDNSELDQRQRWILMTITADDSQLYGVPIPVLSKLIAKLIEDALETAWRVRQPYALLEQGIISFGILLVMILVSLCLIAVQQYIVPRQGQKSSLLWNRRLLQVGHAVIWFPGLGLILKRFPDSYEVGNWLLDNTFTIAIAIISFLLIGRILDIIVKFGESNDRFKTVPIRIFVQLFYILLATLFILIIIANWLNQPLTNVLAAVGAGSAILMLIFKDSIMGFTAGLQLAANRMVALGDWIEMPKYGADGFVNEVSLFTVKVLNWDNTITLIPTYALISDSFKNWRAMFESGGRKIQRSVYIDMTSIKFCDQEIIERFSKIKSLSEYIQKKRQDLMDSNQKYQVIDNSIFLEEKWLTNIEIFRVYVTAYLQAHPKISPGPYFLVRQLQPTEHGLPIEVYVYCNDTAWAQYEEVQADIFDHILSMVPEFELRVFQNPSGYDLKKWIVHDNN